MKYSSTKFIDKIKLDAQKKRIVEEVKRRFDIPEFGLIVIFDSEDYDPTIYPEWGVYAQAIDLSQSDIDTMCPIYFWELTRKNKYRFLIWISKRICIDSDISFCWVVAHEFTHFCQANLEPELLKINTFIHEILPKIEINETKSLISFPIELDAELNAWRISKKFFDKPEIVSYFAEKVKNPKHANSYKMLQNYNPEMRYDVITSTISFLTKYHNKIKSAQNKSTDVHISKFDIDATIEILKNRLWKATKTEFSSGG